MTTRFADHLLEGDHASRPSAATVPEGTLYSCTDHVKIYQQLSAAWGDYFDPASVGGSVATDVIWDAAGDVVVGTGANTAARLAIGNAGGALSRVNGAVAWNSGTAFPTAATGDRFWRTDLARECFYDGTRWLTTQEYTLSHQLSGAGITADTYFTFPLHKSLQTYLTTWDVIAYVSTATTWVVTLQTFDTELDGFTTLDSLSTAGQNSAEMYAETRALDDVVNGTAAHGANVIRGLRVFYDEQAGTSTFFGGVNIRYRLIVT